MNPDTSPRKDAPSRRDWPPLLPAMASLIVPGGGQFLLSQWGRGFAFLATIVLLGGLVGWQEGYALLAPLAFLWLWNAWDAYRLAAGQKSRLGVPILLAALIVYGLGFLATEVRPTRLVTGLPGVRPYLKALTEPELFQYPTEDLAGSTPFQVPCIEPLPPPDRNPTESPSIRTHMPCGDVGESVEVQGSGLYPDQPAELWWLNPIGDRQRVLQNGEPLLIPVDGAGQFRASIKVPLAVPLTSMPKPGETQTHVLRVEQHRPYGSPQPTETLRLVLQKIGETVALAFMATVLGMIIALPLSFLAARNLMWGNRFTRGVYYVVRTVLNVVRSIETLMWAIVFAVWVGLGPYGGMLALMFHTVAALAKLYSEAIESIDPGPIEAVRATGATGPQVVVFAVLPQIVPTFLSFTLYRWDINVRMSTVIGLISDAGLGFLVIQWIRLNNLRAMATAILAIVLVIAILDYVSAWARGRILAGNPSGRKAGRARRYATATLLLVGFLVAFAWSWSVTQVSLLDLVQGVPEGVGMLRDFAVPKVLSRATEERSVEALLPVPCRAGEAPSPVPGGSRVDLSVACGEVGEPLIIRGHDLPPNTDVSVRWALSDGAYLRIKKDCCTTDDAGKLTVETEIHPLMAANAASGRAAPGAVRIVWNEVVGGLRLSQEFKTVVELSLVTLLMSLLATTAGAIPAIPLSFLAARNMTGDSALGRFVYHSLHTIFNLWRSIEPMILALICAAWVGVGPFAGVLALALNNIPNLGKLFSETIEEIDTGPVEAVTATGANRPQTLVFAVVPQLVPKFLAFILYQWDINVRMSTVIGYVGGGGIGEYFRVQVQLNQYATAGMAVWAIVIMVWTMDYLSARAREKLT